MTYFMWLGLDAELFHLGKPEHEYRRGEILRAIGYRNEQR